MIFLEMTSRQNMPRCYHVTASAPGRGYLTQNATQLGDMSSTLRIGRTEILLTAIGGFLRLMAHRLSDERTDSVSI